MRDGVDLGDELDQFVSDQIATGRFTAPDAVLREGLRLLKTRKRKRAEIDAAIAVGLVDGSAGRVKPMDEAFDRLEARLNAAKAATASALSLHVSR